MCTKHIGGFSVLVLGSLVQGGGGGGRNQQGLLQPPKRSDLK